jgi:integrase
MAGVRDRGHYWQIWWWTDKERFWDKLDKLNYPKKRDAYNEAVLREASKENAVRKNIPFREFAINYITDKKPAHSTLETFTETINHFEAFLKGKIMSQVDEKTVKEYINQKKRIRSNSAINRDIVYLKQIIRDALDKQIIRKFDFKGITYLPIERKNPVLPTDREREQILKWFKKNEPYFFAWIYYVITFGWRKSEFIKMVRPDIDLESRIIYIRHAKTGERKHDLSEQDCVVWNEHFLLLKRMKKYSDTGLVYPPLKKSNSGFIGKNILLRKLKDACEALEIRKNIYNHLFRHWVATKILQSGGTAEDVKTRTGHKDTETIMKYYLHATPESVKRARAVTEVNLGLVPKSVPTTVPERS